MSSLKNNYIKLLMQLKKFRLILASNCKQVLGTCKKNQPVVLRGFGKITFGTNVSFGVVNSPRYLNSYAFLESRLVTTEINFGNNISISNDFSIEAEKNVTIEDNVVIGFNCSIFDSNFHDLKSDNRQASDPKPQAVLIKQNVFIGNNVTILKGVSLGVNVVVGACSVVTKSFPDNVIIAGNPAKIINTLS